MAIDNFALFIEVFVDIFIPALAEVKNVKKISGSGGRCPPLEAKASSMQVKARSRQGQGKVKARQRQGQSKVKETSRQGQYNFKAKSNKSQGKVKTESR